MSFHLRRPGGIRNGGLLLALVALAAVMALVDTPPEAGDGQRLPGVYLHLPPPVGITALPPVVDQPSTPAGGGHPSGEAERPASSDRAHPDRKHPRPTGSGSPGRSPGGAVSRPVGGGQGGTGTTRPPVTAPPAAAAPAVSVRVPSVTVRVRPPSVLGRDLGDVRGGDARGDTGHARGRAPPSGLTAVP